MNDNEVIMEVIENEVTKELLVSQIINFLKTDAGIYMLEIIKDTKENRVQDLIYSNKENIFGVQGEVVAYSDILEFLTEDNLKKFAKNLTANQ